MVRIGIVAGEPSGDALGAELLHALRRLRPEFDARGVAGPQMQQAGCRSLAPMSRLAVMGLVEVLGRYAELWRLRRALARELREFAPQVFVGIDAPDFNLGLERALRSARTRTVHLVGPSVWAWRRGRLRGIARSVDLMLVLFPFEEAIYRAAGIPVVCIGHPLADRIAQIPDRGAARARLGLGAGATLIALLPGSRRAELARHVDPFLLAAARCHAARAGLHFVAAPLSEADADFCRARRHALGLDGLPLEFHAGRASDVLEAADACLLASGTIALEAMLFKRPMVVAYRLNPISYRIIRSMIQVRHVALPNLLAGETLVPECLQDECNPQRLAAELLHWLDEPQRVAAVQRRFDALHAELRRDAGASAARAVLELATGA
jgi:lipid-A-disaccharide synthase